MIRKDMKPGDTFEDFGRYFVVVAVNENGTYSSRQIERPETDKQEPTVKRKPRRKQ